MPAEKTYCIALPETGLKPQFKLHLTASKSESNRVLIIRALCAEFFEINNLAAAQDTQTLLRLLHQKAGLFDAGHAGTTMRFLTAYLTASGIRGELTGSERMKERPIGILVEALRKLGATIHCKEKEGYPPLVLASDGLSGGSVPMDGSVSSQFISALLLIAPTLEKGLKIDLRGKVISRPYINMTLRMLEHFGAKAAWEGTTIAVKEGGYSPRSFTVESDWSAASYWYAVAALAKNTKIYLKGLKKKSLQGDAVLVPWFEKLGVHSAFDASGVWLSRLPDFRLPEIFAANFEDCPDIAQTIATVCAGLQLKADLTGLQTLRIKETDRVLALQQELQHFGVPTEAIGKDRLLILPNAPPAWDGTAITTYHDHRMAMAFAPLAMRTGKLHIANPGVVKKSYPHYWDHLKTAGFAITVA